MSVGRNIPHDSAYGHVSGTSEYIDDRAFLKQELLVSYIGSPVARGELLAVDFSQALKIPGIVGVLTAKDVHHNIWGSIFKDQPLLVEKQISYFDEPICLIAGENNLAIAQAKKLVKLKIQEQLPVLDLQDAIDKKDFLYTAVPFIKGDVDAIFSVAKNQLSGHFYSGGQEHFYLENQAAVVYPLEGEQLEVHSSSQHPTETQHLVAEACGLPFHQVSCIVKRMGGGFGGKESQAAPIAAYAALFAQKFQRPARMVLTKDEDMQVTGKRHPFKTFYQVAFDNEGILQALRVNFFADGGAYCDLSSSILERAMFHVDGAYYIPNASIHGQVCRTNTASNTAFRGFGGPQGTLLMEVLMEDIAQYLGLDPLLVRRRNCYGKTDRNITPYGQKVENNVLPELFFKLEESADYHRRQEQILQFNQSSPRVKRGLSLTATKFGIAFTARHLNQGNALVNLHRDGSLQVSTGATEMGQGVNTKIQQIVAHALGVPALLVRVLTTSTERNANTSPTAASSGSDINGAAALKACEQIKLRLSAVAYHLMRGTVPTGSGELSGELPLGISPEDFEFTEGKIRYLAAIPEGKTTSLELLKVIETAYFHRISLCEYAHFRTENLGFDKQKVSGQAFNYFTNGVAASEVQIDLDSGEMKVLRTDILMDVGRSINPGIDRGQVTGAFVQGMGWLTTEKLFYDVKGKLLTHSPTTYKIPNIQDTPRVFNIDFFDNDSTSMNVLRSKAVGEPPFLLGISVFTAVKAALHSVSPQGARELLAPATPEAILFASMKS